jgi:hypothetical protein
MTFRLLRALVPLHRCVASKKTSRRANTRRTRPGVEQLEDRRLLSISPSAVEVFGTSPALFVENQGQWADDSLRYAFQGAGANVLHTDDGIVFELLQPDSEGMADNQGSVQFTVSFDEAAPLAPQGLDRTETVHNYYVGEPSRWRSGVSTYETVAYEGLYDGIDLYTWGRRDHLKYEFHVAPGTDYQQIQVSYAGIEGLWLDDGRGNLVGRTGRQRSADLSTD